LSLAGRTVVVTRDEPADGPLSRALAERGATVRNVPLVAVAPAGDAAALEEALSGLGSGDWLFLTSARAVSALPEGPVAAGGAARVAAVGRATASAWERRTGKAPDLVGAGGAAELAAELVNWLAAEAGPAGGGENAPRVLWPASDRHRPQGVAALEAGGLAVRVVEAYRVVPRGEGVAELARLLREPAPPDAVAVTSPSAAEGLVEAAGELRPLVAAIGGTTASALREAGWPEPLRPDRPGLEALADTLAGHFGPGSGAGS
jgi:uroporphyrinogen-III synthase